MTRDDQLLIDVMGWFEADADVQELLGDDGDVVPAAIAMEVDVNPRLFVGVSETTSERDNFREDKEFAVRVGVFATTQWVARGGTVLELTQLKARAKDVLTEHRDGWGALGVQADEEIQPTSEPDGYLGVVETAYERDDPHATHQ